jgi:hypothetical protein
VKCNQTCPKGDIDPIRQTAVSKSHYTWGESDGPGATQCANTQRKDTGADRQMIGNMPLCWNLSVERDRLRRSLSRQVRFRAGDKVPLPLDSLARRTITHCFTLDSTFA